MATKEKKEKTPADIKADHYKAVYRKTIKACKAGELRQQKLTLEHLESCLTALIKGKPAAFNLPFDDLSLEETIEAIKSGIFKYNNPQF